MDKPKPPLSRRIREGDTGKKCPKCESSLLHRFKYFPFFFKSKHCIQPECENYGSHGGWIYNDYKDID